MTTLYSCKSEIDHAGNTNFRITKFDGDMNVESSYIVHGSNLICNCPAGVRPSCRHRDMLPKFIARGAVNSMWMFDFDRDGWVSMDLEGDLTASAFANIVGPLPNDLLNDIPMIETTLKDGSIVRVDKRLIDLGVTTMEREVSRALSTSELMALPQYQGVPYRKVESLSPEPSPSTSPLLRRF